MNPNPDEARSLAGAPNHDSQWRRHARHRSKDYPLFHVGEWPNLFLGDTRISLKKKLTSFLPRAATRSRCFRDR